MEKKITIGNVCFIRDKTRQKVLLLQRNRDPMKNLSTGVGGKTEFHEDIHLSCLREVFEETGLRPTKLQLKGILKTILEGGNSSWILFTYTAESEATPPPECNEGILEWVSIEDLSSRNVIGFIHRVLPHILNDSSFFEGTIVHDEKGQVLSDTLKIHELPQPV